MLSDAPFLLSLAALNASLAGLGGLLVGLRRATGVDPFDNLRLRQVVEFAFANVLLAISVQPLTLLLGDPELAIRVASGVTLVYVVVAMLVLNRRVGRIGLDWDRSWAAAALGLTLLGVAVSAIGLLVPTTGVFELLLVVMLARPISVFLLVLTTLDDARADQLDSVREERSDEWRSPRVASAPSTHRHAGVLMKTPRPEA